MIRRHNLTYNSKGEYSYLIDCFCCAIQQGATLISHGPFLEINRPDQNLPKLNLDWLKDTDGADKYCDLTQPFKKTLAMVQ